MTHSSLPENWQELLAGYVLGDLDPEEASQVHQWLETYPEVASELTALQETWCSLPQTLPPETPPPHLRDQVLVATSPSPKQPREVKNSRLKIVLGGMGVGWAATAIALGAVLMENQSLRQDQQQSEAIVASLAQLQSRLVSLSGTEVEPKAQARLIIDPQNQEVFLATEDLSPLPEEQVYRLWAVVGETPTYCGEFNPNRDREIYRWELPSSSCEASNALILITRESIDAPLTPQGELVLQPSSQS